MSTLPTKGLYYRVHDSDREFASDNATSSVLFGGASEQDGLNRNGYSATDHPWKLWAYTLIDGWQTLGLSRNNPPVIAFTGEETDNGFDGEPLVTPDMETVHRFTWQEFTDRLPDTPFSDTWLWGENATSPMRELWGPTDLRDSDATFLHEAVDQDRPWKWLADQLRKHDRRQSREHPDWETPELWRHVLDEHG